MVVGDLPERETIASCLRKPPITVSNLFDAIGEVSTASVHEPIAAVLIDDRCVDAHFGQAIDALRKLDPSLVLVLAARAAATAATWTERGLDECLVAPVRSDDLRRIFDDDLLDADNFSAADRVVELADEPAVVVSPPADALPTTEKTPQEPKTRDHQHSLASDAAPISERKIDPFAHQPQAPAEVSPEASNASHAEDEDEEVAPPLPLPPLEQDQVSKIHDDNERLGDTDLIEAMLSNPTGVRALALRLIAQQTGWHDIALMDSASHDAAASALNACAAVEFNGQQFGTLTTSQASATQLEPWAAWLARWLALDHSHRSYRRLAFQDDLTGAWNRRFFNSFLRDVIAQAAQARRPVTLMVFDIDNFKTYNDQFGHEAGDEILQETVKLMHSVIRQGDRVCRIGGDEFAVIFADPEGPRTPGSMQLESIEAIARRFQEQICKMRFPKLGAEAPGTLSISAGLATYPWDGADPDSLVRHADQLALKSKHKGKNIITFGPGAAKACRQTPQD